MSIPAIPNALLCTLWIALNLSASDETKLASVPLLDCSGLPCVKVTNSDGKRLRQGIDTGNPTSILGRAAAQILGVALEPYVTKDGKTVPGVQRGVVRGARMGEASVGDLRVAVFDLSAPFQNGTMPKMDGTLVSGAFKGRLLQLAVRKQEVRASAPLSETVPCPGSCGTIALTPFRHKGPPIVTATGFAVNGQPILAQVDTMHSGTLLIFHTPVSKLGLYRESQAAKRRHLPFTDGGVDMVESRAASETFGPTPLAHDGLFDATDGIGLIEGRTVAFDFHGMRMWLERSLSAAIPIIHRLTRYN